MRQLVRPALAALAATVLLGSPVLAQQPKTDAGQTKAAPPARPAPTAAELAKMKEPLATVNGEAITRGQLVQFLSQYQIGPGTEQAAYESGMDILVNTHLLTQFLNAQKVKVTPEQVEQEIQAQRAKVSEAGSSLESALADTGMTLDALKDTIRQTIQWREYVKRVATDVTLKAYMEANKDAFNGTLVKASHIQASLDEGASEADKQKAREKLLAIKKEIESGAIAFPDAANKYSEDPSNKEQPSGGDLRWFPRKGRFTDKFAEAAFALKKGTISNPIETEYGYHLIQVTDRKDGGALQYERIKPRIEEQFAVDEQARIVAEARKTAKIDIKPMPADLFGPAPSPAAAPAAGAAAKEKTATPKPQ